jgi:HlyD family secretion protein
MSSTTTQNVVTYPVVVSVPNPDLKLRPGMTANLSFQLQKKSQVLRVPNAALRFYPQIGQVRPEDRKLLETKAQSSNENDEKADKPRSASEKAELRRQRNRRYVWVVDGPYLRAVEIIAGLSDSSYTEMLSGNVREGDKLVTGVEPRN